MRVKTYRGPDTKSILDRIKSELGPDAVILSTKNYKENGRPQCEVTAALEEEKRSAPGDKEKERELDDLSIPGWGEWRREWSKIKDHLRVLLRREMDLESLSPKNRLALEYLEREGVGPEAAVDIYRRLKSGKHGSILEPLSDMIAVKPWGEEGWPQRFHALAGPYGAGKTSALIRMALHLRSERPGVRVVIVNADLEKSGGRLVLRHFCELSDLEYLEVADREGFAELAGRTADFDKALIDLPSLVKGMTLERLSDRIGLDAIEDLRIHLVLSPHFSRAQLDQFERRYFSPQVSGIIWTKLDEAESFGQLVNVSAGAGLPVSGLSFGHTIRETFVPARLGHILRLLFKRQLPGQGQGEK